MRNKSASPNLFSVQGLVMATFVVLSITPARLSETHSFEPVQSAILVTQDLSGTYPGRIYLGKGATRRTNGTLRIDKQNFIFTPKTGPQIRWKIDASLIPDKENLGVGHVQMADGAKVEIRWYRNEKRTILKVVRAWGARREFRFCTATLDDTQCFGSIK